MNVTDLLQKARAKGLRFATAESCTGGMVSAALTDIPGSSDVVECGFITYSNSAKISMLDVAPDTLSAHGAVSEETAKEMVTGALKNSGADIAVSITGIAGPGGSEFKPEGRVCFGVGSASGVTAHTVEFGALGRENVRRASLEHALSLFAEATNQQ